MRNHSLLDRISADCYEQYMKACAEKHVLNALDVHKKSQPAVNDVVSSALVTLQAPEQCPGPNCGISVEHDGD